MNPINWLMVLMIPVMLWICTADTESQVQEMEDQQYVEMVCIHQQTDGEFGWPPYRRNVEVICND